MNNFVFQNLLIVFEDTPKENKKCHLFFCIELPKKEDNNLKYALISAFIYLYVCKFMVYINMFPLFLMSVLKQCLLKTKKYLITRKKHK